MAVLILHRRWAVGPEWRALGPGREAACLPQVIKINAITVPEGSGDELGRRFAARAGAVDDQDGFEGFELLKPTDERTTWLVITRWRDEESFQAWVNSPAFGHGHAGADRPAPHGGPVSVSSELWSYEVSTTSPGHG
jgi:heme oxygenase (mycobilin-producing)